MYVSQTVLRGMIWDFCYICVHTLYEYKNKNIQANELTFWKLRKNEINPCKGAGIEWKQDLHSTCTFTVGRVHILLAATENERSERNVRIIFDLTSLYFVIFLKVDYSFRSYKKQKRKKILFLKTVSLSSATLLLMQEASVQASRHGDEVAIFTARAWSQ